MGWIKTTVVLGGVAAGVITPAAMILDPSNQNGSEILGCGLTYNMYDPLREGTAFAFNYGAVDDELYVGDWDGDGIDTLAIRRGNNFYIKNSNTSGPADYVVSIGQPEDAILVGDWNGDGRDSFAVRRGNTYMFKYDLAPGPADHIIEFGLPGQEVIAGDWNGDGKDTLAIRQWPLYLAQEELVSGWEGLELVLGNPVDEVFAGDFFGDGMDTFATRTGDVFTISRSLQPNMASDMTVSYGTAEDTAFIGDWEGDGVDTIGIRVMPEGMNYLTDQGLCITGDPQPSGWKAIPAKVAGLREHIPFLGEDTPGEPEDVIVAEE